MSTGALERLEFFKGLPPADLKILSAHFNSLHFPADTVIFQQGDIAAFLYLVIRGEVIIRYKPSDGAAMTVSHVQPGGVFGWSAALGNVTYTSYAICAVDSEVLRVSGVELRSICEQDQRIGQFILGRLTNVISSRWQVRQKKQVMSILAQRLCVQPDGMAEEKTMPKIDTEEEQIKALVEQLSAYIEHFHGGSVEYVSFDGRILKVRMGGACLGCPLSPATLHGWVEGTVKQFFPHISAIEEVE